VKNFAVNQLFELGWVGALATAFLLLVLGARMAARGLVGDSYAAVSLAALTGCMMVGLFDSITDVPRLTIVFLLVALAGSLKPARKRIKVRRQRRETEDEGADTLSG
jgi:O-antigen ligase